VIGLLSLPLTHLPNLNLHFAPSLFRLHADQFLRWRISCPFNASSLTPLTKAFAKPPLPARKSPLREPHFDFTRISPVFELDLHAPTRCRGLFPRNRHDT
jgi:hypothetical protein